MYFPLFMALNDPTDKDKAHKEKCKKLDCLTEEDIKRHLKERLSFTGNGKDIYSRYSAYDYCYNCFRDIHEDFLKREKRELSSNEKENLCKQLGLFLGTWGMFRNSNLQKCSYKIYEPLIEKIFKEEKLWDIDVDKYCEEDTLNDIINFKDEIQKSFDELELPDDNKVSVTPAQATKIMMVVFGCVPAYDSFFSSTLEPMSFGKNSLKYIYKFYHDYQENKELLDQKQKELRTVSVKGGLTNYTYTIAKIIDIIGFHVREEEIKNQKNS
jgi:hypothetical protein